MRSLVFISLIAFHLITSASQLPTCLQGETFLFEDDNITDKDNPNAGQKYLMHFGENTFQYQIIGTATLINGTFTYWHLNEREEMELGILENTELYDGECADYQMILLPKSTASGQYLFKQKTGPIKPNVRLNTGHYTRILIAPFSP